MICSNPPEHFRHCQESQNRRQFISRCGPWRQMNAEVLSLSVQGQCKPFLHFDRKRFRLNECRLGQVRNVCRSNLSRLPPLHWPTIGMSWWGYALAMNRVESPVNLDLKILNVFAMSSGRLQALVASSVSLLASTLKSPRCYQIWI